jgi:hypothetical protein
MLFVAIATIQSIFSATPVGRCAYKAKCHRGNVRSCEGLVHGESD